MFWDIETIVLETMSGSKYKIIIDTREKNYKILKDEITSKGALCEYQFLSTGDFWITDTNTHTRCAIIERKTPQDLWASIVDGRYKKQCAAMKEAQAPIWGYVVIGSWTGLSDVALKAVHTAMTKLQVRDKAFVTYLAHERFLAYWLCKFSETIESFLFIETGVKSNSKGSIPLSPPEAAPGSRKHSIWLNQLCCIPGVGITVAQTLVKHFPTVQSLIQFLETNDDGVKQIAQFKLSTGRSIGLSLALKIHQGFIKAIEVTH